MISPSFILYDYVEVAIDSQKHILFAQGLLYISFLESVIQCFEFVVVACVGCYILVELIAILGVVLPHDHYCQS